MKGGYILILKNDKQIDLVFTKNNFKLIPAIYLYSGSALGLGGIESRVERHTKMFFVGHSDESIINPINNQKNINMGKYVTFFPLLSSNTLIYYL